MTTLLPAFCGPIERFVAIARGNVCVAENARWDKRQKGTHRCTIADTRGPLTLTVPIEKAPLGRPWSSIRVSTHGNWQAVMLTAWESAYGRTPFFEYYIDRLAQHIPAAGTEMPLLTELDRALEAELCKILLINPPTVAPAGAAVSALLPLTVPPYWQVRAHQLGFIPGLSILDLVFNLGPDAVLYLDRLKECQDK